MRRNGLGLYTMGIAALFLMGFFLLVVFGAQAYREAADSQARHNEQRALLSYLSTCLKGCDRAGGVYIRQEAGPVLVMADGSGYALHIYQRDGELLEEYSAEDAALDPGAASVLGSTVLFSVEEVRPGTFEIETDAGRVLLHQRSGEGPG